MSENTDPSAPDDGETFRPTTRRARRTGIGTASATRGGARPVILLGGVILLLAALLLTWFLLRDDADGESAGVSERSEEPGVDGVIHPEADPDEWLAGDCLTDFQAAEEAAPATIIDCDQGYEVQVVHWEDLDADAFPGETEIAERARMACEEHGELDQEAVDSVDVDLEVRISHPTESTWTRDDDRRVNCLLQAAGGAPLTGNFVVDPDEDSAADDAEQGGDG